MTPRGSTRVAAVLGHPVGHSRSPALHNAAYAAIGLDAIYVALDVAPGRVEGAVQGLASLGFMGANVTVPHKEAALRACPWVDQVAQQANAVNTIVVEGGDIRGYNTDVPGLARALREEAPQLTGGAAVVLGGGGAARAAILAARELGFEVTAIVRRPEVAGPLRALECKVVPWTTAAMTPLFIDCGLLIDATSIAMSREAEANVPAPLPLDRLPERAVVSSLVYHRLPSLLEAARQRGLTAIDGGGMLVHQAALAFELMTGRSAPLEAMRRAFADAALRDAAAGAPSDPLPENADAPR